jgi:bifunctional enzyme CysN/CysC
MNPLRIVMVGHVDHGKSTLLGRLLHDTGSLPDGKQQELEKISQRRGSDIEWSFVLDAFQAERDQNVTIDTTQVAFKSDNRGYVMIDAPGHREFLKNMISGAARADAAILVVDVTEGLQEQTRRHAYLAHLLGLKNVIVAINKMDAAGYGQAAFIKTKDAITSYLTSLDIVPSDVIPLAARHGVNVVNAAPEMNWYHGPTLLAALDQLPQQAPPHDLPLRFAVQDVYKFGYERIIVGRVEQGMLRTGDRLFVSPDQQSAIIKAIKVWPDQPEKNEAQTGESVGLTLSDRLFIERGHVLSHENAKPSQASAFKARLFWLDAAPLQMGQTYKLRSGTQEATVTVIVIDRIIDTQDLSAIDIDYVAAGMVAEVNLRAHDALALDHAGRIVLFNNGVVVGGGVITELMTATSHKSDNITATHHLVTADIRAVRAGYHGQVFWLTGLSGAGKSTLAMRVEKMLFERGYQTYVLDGDNVRHGLCTDLGFSDTDRRENIRRVGEVAALMADAGMVVISAFISPFANDRARARMAAKGRFHEIYIRADLRACEARDPKGLYAKARAGQIRDFTGIDSPYENPQTPELVIDTVAHDIDHCVTQILEYIENAISLKPVQEKIRAF